MQLVVFLLVWWSVIDTMFRSIENIHLARKIVCFFLFETFNKFLEVNIDTFGHKCSIVFSNPEKNTTKEEEEKKRNYMFENEYC